MCISGYFMVCCRVWLDSFSSMCLTSCQQHERLSHCTTYSNIWRVVCYNRKHLLWAPLDPLRQSDILSHISVHLKKVLLFPDKIHNRTCRLVCPDVTLGLRGGVSKHACFVDTRVNSQVILTSYRCVKAGVSWFNLRDECCVGGRATHWFLCWRD